MRINAFSKAARGFSSMACGFSALGQKIKKVFLACLCFKKVSQPAPQTQKEPTVQGPGTMGLLLGPRSALVLHYDYISGIDMQQVFERALHVEELNAQAEHLNSILPDPQEKQSTVSQTPAASPNNEDPVPKALAAFGTTTQVTQDAEQ